VRNQHRHCPHCGKHTGNFWGSGNPKTSWQDILKFMVDAKKPLPLKSICEALEVSRGACWTQLDRMRVWGMVKKVKVRENIFWVPTPYGISKTK
jgi:biotin operon repressor